MVWSNTSVDLGVKVTCRFDSLKEIIMDNVGGPQANLLKALTAKTFSRKIALLQDCILEILLEFQACCPALQILESRLQHSFLTEFPA